MNDAGDLPCSECGAPAAYEVLAPIPETTLYERESVLCAACAKRLAEEEA
jgi:hypothetical protein